MIAAQHRGFVHESFINNPPSVKLLSHFLIGPNQKLGLFFCGTIDKTLLTYIQNFHPFKTCDIRFFVKQGRLSFTAVIR